MRDLWALIHGLISYGPLLLSVGWMLVKTGLRLAYQGLKLQARVQVEMTMQELLAKLFEGITEGLKLAQVKDAHKYQDQFVKLQLDLAEEKKKGYDRDDARIEDLYKQLEIIAEAAKNEIARAGAAVPHT
jgi:hypothetical protein